MAIFLFFLCLGSSAWADDPILYFTDLTSGPKSGNSDASAGRVPGQDGAIITLWGRHLGTTLDSTRVYCNGAPAASYYFLGAATQPANLAAFHQMQMLVFQVSHSATDGAGEIQVEVAGRRSSPLPFTVRNGGIFFVATNGNDDTGTGAWSQPWQTVLMAVDTLAPGDIAYIGDGVNQTNASDADAKNCVRLGSDGMPGYPKALVVYPGATSRIGHPAVQRAFHIYSGEHDGFSLHWVIAKFTVTTAEVGVPAYTGFRVVGNYITAPEADGLDGAIDGQGDDVHVLGNELDRVGAAGCSKFYHAIYFKGFRQDDPPRAPTESGRQIAWNYVHDCNSNRGINIYSEQDNSAFIQEHNVHDNVILRQHGDGIMLGEYITGTNWVFNNLVVQAGLGPEWAGGETSYHTGIRINTGHTEVAQTVVHCYHNTLYGCGADTWFPDMTGHLLVSPEALRRSTVYFVNNLVYSTGQPYIATESGAVPTGDFRNGWFGQGLPPAWDTGAIADDPQLIDPDHGNFSLRKGSPCIDAGRDVTAIVPRDLLGVTRLQGSGPDLGALEFSALSTLRLQAALVAHRLTLTWNGGNGIRLQRAPTFLGGAWIDVEDSEGQSVFDVAAEQAGEFFRLIRR